MSTDIIAPEPMIIDEPPVEEARVPEEHIEHTQEEAEEPTVALLRLTEVWRTDRLFTIINEQTTDDCTIRAVINALRARRRRGQGVAAWGPPSLGMDSRSRRGHMLRGCWSNAKPGTEQVCSDGSP